MTAFYTVQPITDFTIFTTPPAQRKGVQFKAKWSTTVDELERELDHLAASNVVLEIGVDARHIRLDGQLRADARSSHPGVRLSFETRDHGPLSYTCDTYEARYYGQIPDWQSNVRAIVLTLESLRAVDRYGATKGEQYAGFKALGAAMGGMTKDQAIALLAEFAGIPVEHFNTEQSSLHHSWRSARRQAHPDRNDGDQTQWDRVEQAARVLGLSE